MKLGNLTEVDIRSIWAHEQYDFSQWLASKENINKLGETLGLSLSDIETEKKIGSYRCDIACKDILTEKIVLIENQLEEANHEHLGKIVTYAAGLEASVIVWIVAKARPEHIRAIEWINKNTNGDIAFFLIELHAYKIDDSAPAPSFTIINKQPNEFVKTAKALLAKGDMHDAEAFRLDFWNKFNDAIEKNGKPFNTRKTSTDNWFTVSIGSSQWEIKIYLSNQEHKIRVSFNIKDNKALYDKLFSHKADIETIVGEPLDWDRADSCKSSFISLSIPGLNFADQNNYPQLMNMTIEKVVVLRDSITKYINA